MIWISEQNRTFRVARRADNLAVHLLGAHQRDGRGVVWRHDGGRARQGRIVETGLGPPAVATIHPSVVLRARDEESRAEQQAMLVEDLTRVARLLERA